MVKYIKYKVSNGYAGCDEEGVLALVNNETDDQIDDIVYGIAMENADMYAYVAEGNSFDDGWESEEDEQWYYENIGYFWKEITEKEFDEWED